MAASALVVLELSGNSAVSVPTGVVPAPSAVGSAVVVNQSRLNDSVANAGMVAARQHVIIAEQVLAIV